MGRINFFSFSVKPGKIKHIMLDSEDLYTDVNNDVELFLSLKDRVKRICEDYDVELLQLYGVVFA